MNIQTSLLALMLSSVASLSIAVGVKADTVQARCDVYPLGSDRASSSDVCTFSQRQGSVSIQLKNGKRYELRPVGNEPGNYLDGNGQQAYRQTGLGDRGQIYRLAKESIYVYWDTAPLGQATSKPSTIAQRGISTLRSNNPNARINVRSQPTINSPAPQYGLPGDPVKVLQCVPDKDTKGSDLNWCKVQFVRSKAVGWVRSDFIIFADGGE